MPAQDSNSGDLIGNEEKVSSDFVKVMRYVKDELFLRVIDIYSKDGLDMGKYLYNDYMKNCKSLVTDLGAREELTPKWSGYMKYLWSQMVVKKSYRNWLCLKRSNAYQAVQDRFVRK